MATDKPRRICRTPDECFEAGWEAAADFPPLTPAQIAYLAPLWRPFVSRDTAA